VNSAASFRALSSFWRFASIVAVFLLMWPLISGILVWLTRFNDDDWIGSAIFYFAYSYPLFAPSAVLAGVICAVAALRFGSLSVWIPVGAAIAAETLFLTSSVLTMSPDALARGNIAIGLGFSLLMSLIASLICWRLTRRFTRPA
jgi:hypothetical protein